jgi:hypothetical protein
MRVLGFGFLVVWLLAPGLLAIMVADTVQAPEITQSLAQPISDVEEDLLNLLD